MTDNALGGVEAGVIEAGADEGGVDDEVVGVEEETVELVELVELILDVDELDEVEELVEEEESDVLETTELETDETCGTMEGVGEGDALGDEEDEIATGGSLPAPKVPIPEESGGALALILIMRLRSTWSRR